MSAPDEYLDAGGPPGRLDPNVEQVRHNLEARARMGLAKYGNDTTKLALVQALKHAQEEAMDLCVYLEQVIRKIEEGQ